MRNNNNTIFWPKRNNEFLDRLLVNEQLLSNKNYSFAKLKDYSNSLFSLNALNDSIYTLMSQSENSTDRTSLGFNPAKDFKEMVHYEGSWVLFKQKQDLLKQIFSTKNKSIYDSQKWSIDFEAIKRTIQLAEEKGIKLTLFINPYHYSYLEVIYNSGYWNEFANFKKTLVETVNKYGKNHVEIWDFSVYSNYSVTIIPKKGSPEPQPNWFWEPAHYKAELGDRMLSDIFNTNCMTEQKENVGKKLNNMDINGYLTQQQNRRSILLKRIRFTY